MSKQGAKSKVRREAAKVTEGTPQTSVASVETSEKKSFIKEKTPEEKQKAHKEGIIKTVVASILGILAGFIAFSLYGTGEDRLWYAVLMIVIGLTYLVQKFLYPLIKVDVKEFKAKDWFYVEFVVVDFFLVVWTLLLN